jgi:hypothetical protein
MLKKEAHRTRFRQTAAQRNRTSALGNEGYIRDSDDVAHQGSVTRSGPTSAATKPSITSRAAS